jgi:hypothetical protein
VSPKSAAKVASGLLADGHDVPFAEIEATLAQLVRDARRKRSPARALISTIVVVGKPDRLIAAVDALEQLGVAGVARAILISEGEHTSPVARVTETAIAISGLAPGYLNNAVAALRLSSLPAVVWWRGGSVDALADLAALADRVILDAEEPDAAWADADKLFEHTALTDLRWATLTKWRACLAHLYDLPHVRRHASEIKTLTIEAIDIPSARLFAGWLRVRLQWPSTVTIDIRQVQGTAPAPLRCVMLNGGELSISLQVRGRRDCLEAAVGGAGEGEVSARIVPLGDGTLSSLIGEELGVRTRDLAFEQALVAAREIQA